MPGGFIMVKNDANFLYLALDLVSDTGNTPGVGDYFWLSFDNDRNAAITSNFDVNYGIYPSLPIKIARQNYLGAGTWTGILGGLSSSATAQGFSATPTFGGSAPHLGDPRGALRDWGCIAGIHDICRTCVLACACPPAAHRSLPIFRRASSRIFSTCMRSTWLRDRTRSIRRVPRVP